METLKNVGIERLDKYCNGDIIAYFDEDCSLNHMIPDGFSRFIIRTFSMYQKSTGRLLTDKAYFLNIRAFINCLEKWNDRSGDWIYFPTIR